MNPFIVGDLVTQLKETERSWSKRTIHRVSKVDGDSIWVDNNNYKHDAIDYRHCMLVTLTSPEHVKR